MGFGSILLGGLADKIGRKPSMLLCLVIMAAGMYMAHAATSVSSLTAFRLFTGLGIGGMLAATNAGHRRDDQQGFPQSRHVRCT